jgi:hypothetical protein
MLNTAGARRRTEEARSVTFIVTATSSGVRSSIW